MSVITGTLGGMEVAEDVEFVQRREDSVQHVDNQ